MNREDIITHVDALTEHRASRQIDMTRLFELRLQKFCQEKRYWWREKRGSFTTVAGTATYDLTSSSYGDMDDIDELERVIWIESAASGDFTELNLVIEPSYRLLASLQTTQDRPSAYFIEANTLRTLRLTPVPNEAKTVYVYYWAIPIPAVDRPDGTIPLVPEQYHNCLIDGLKMDVFEFLYGVESPKYQAAVADYKNMVDKANSKNASSVQKRLQWISKEAAVSSSVPWTSLR